MANNMASTGLWKMLYLPVLQLTTDDTIGCAAISLGSFVDCIINLVSHSLALGVTH